MIIPSERTDESIFDEEERLEALKKEELENSKKLTNAIKFVMNTKNGRDVISWILSQTGLDASVSSTDPIVMSNLSGRRDVGLAIKQRLLADCPESVAEMEKEQRNG